MKDEEEMIVCADTLKLFDYLRKSNCTHIQNKSVFIGHDTITEEERCIRTLHDMRIETERCSYLYSKYRDKAAAEFLAGRGPDVSIRATLR